MSEKFVLSFFLRPIKTWSENSWKSTVLKEVCFKFILHPHVGYQSIQLDELGRFSSLTIPEKPLLVPLLPQSLFSQCGHFGTLSEEKSSQNVDIGLIFGYVLATTFSHNISKDRPNRSGFRYFRNVSPDHNLVIDRSEGSTLHIHPMPTYWVPLDPSRRAGTIFFYNHPQNTHSWTTFAPISVFDIWGLFHSLWRKLHSECPHPADFWICFIINGDTLYFQKSAKSSWL